MEFIDLAGLCSRTAWVSASSRREGRGSFWPAPLTSRQLPTFAFLPWVPFSAQTDEVGN